MTRETSTTRPPACGDPASLLIDFYLGGSLDPQEAETVSRHVEMCAVCAAEVEELRDLAAAIDQHGAEGDAGAEHFRIAESRVTERRSLRAVFVAAAVLLVAVAAAWLWRNATVGPREAPVVAGGTEVALDLAAGVLREGGEVPGVTLPRGTTTVRVTFFPPLLEGTDARVAVLDAAGGRVLEPAPLPPLDPAGSAAIVIPAASLPRSGRYELVLHPTAQPDEPTARIAAYPFDVKWPEPAP